MKAPLNWKQRISEMLGVGFIQRSFWMVVFGLWIISSCTYKKGEVSTPTAVDPCDSSLISYAVDIDSIIILNCMLGCHTGGFPIAGPDLNSYELVKAVAVYKEGACVCGKPLSSYV